MTLALGQESELTKIQTIENDVSALKERVTKLEDKTLEVLGVIGGLITGIATVILVIVLLYQSKILLKTSQLASGPKLFPRYIPDKSTNTTHIIVYNVGKSNAIDVHLEFSDANNNSLGVGKIDRYSLTSIDIQTYDPISNTWRPELVETGISFTTGNNFRYRIKGSYKDTNEEKITIDQMYEFPPRIVE